MIPRPEPRTKQQIWNKNWRLRNKEKIAAYNKKWKEAHPGSSALYNSHRKGKRRVYDEQYRESHRSERIARNRVYRAVRSGRLIPLACHECGSQISQAHHPDYSKPLEVIWLCPSHHMLLHKAI